jgi:PAS domain S-box-containing protein
MQSSSAFDFRHLKIDTVPDAVFWIDSESKVVGVNDVACEQMGYTREELLQMRIDHISTNFLKLSWDELWRKLQKEKTLLFETQHIRKNGERFPVEIRTNYVVYEGKEFVSCFVRDITKFKRAEKESEESKRILKTMFDAIPDSLGILNPDFGVEYYNQAALDLLNITEQDYKNKKCFELIHRKIPCKNCLNRRTFKTGKPYSEERYVDDLGLWLDVRSYPIRNEKGEVVKVIEHLRDITKNKAAETELKETYESLVESEKENRLSYFVIDRAADAIVIFDPEGNLVRMNDVACTLWEYSRDELVSMNVLQINQNYTKRKWKVLWNKVISKKVTTYETSHMTKHGKEIPMEVTSNYLQFEDTEYMVSFCRDITQRRKTEQQIKNALKEIEELKNRLEAENLYLQDEIKLSHNFDEIITQNNEFKKVLTNVERVASTDSTVLLLGETGTGKELLARAIHDISNRLDRPLVKVNCAALPSSLIESELFGYEKGAFTGALTQKIGRFELANKGTLFLDEIGELPIELQPKLLRVLQDGEFERLGNPRTIKVNVRIIAATNRNLKEEVKRNNFRADLYYRLNVFPVEIPPLRKRKEDIPILINHFIHKFSTRVGKSVESIPHKTMATLLKYDWPGNVRELENLIERALIISTGKDLKIGDWFSASDTITDEFQSLEEIEKNYITKVLAECNYKIRGESGAAAVLGLKPTTLEARMKKLNISKK